ncbi:MAG TPA: hypothetical protein VK327_15905, partial [Candidatus Paceibacterota bacterium]|nr:hypothetical protein [Candidatus Paceibacterota bacterium]
DLRCAALLEVGETEAAFHDAQCALRVPELLREEPFLISQLVRLAQGSIATRTVWQGLAEHRWTDAQLAAFQNAFSRINYLPGLELAFEGERACGIQTMDGWISKGGMISQTVGPDENGSSMQFPTRFLSRGLLRQNEIALARYHQQMIASVRSAISNAPESGLAAVAKNASDVTDRTGRDLRPFSPYKVMAAMLAPALGKAVQKAARAQTTARMATVACALERYRIAHGTFPETLESLAPQFIAQMPLDPMVNQPFHYQRTEDGWFQLYSVGLNGKDDGGVLLSDDKKDKEDKDWPWPVPTRPQKRNLF